MDAIISAGAHLQSFGYGPDTDFKRLAFLGLLLSWAMKTFAAPRPAHRDDSRTKIPAAADESLSHRETWAKARDWEVKKSRSSLVRPTYELLTAAATALGATSLFWKATYFLIKKADVSPGRRVVVTALTYTTIRNTATVLTGIPITIYDSYVTGDGQSSLALARQAVLGIPSSEAMRWAVGFPGLQKVSQLATRFSTLQICTAVIAANFLYRVVWPNIVQPSILPLQPLEEGDLRQSMAGLARRQEFPLRDVMVLKETFPALELNPYYSGVPWARTIVIYDTLLLKAEPEEIEALVARQLYLWKYSYPIYQIAFEQLNFILRVFAMAQFLPNTLFFAAFGLPASMTSSTILAYCVGSDLVDCIRAPFDTGLALASASLQKRFEIGSDRFAASLGYKKSLSSVILKLKRRQLTKRYTLDPLAMGWKPNASLEDRLRAIEAC